MISIRFSATGIKFSVGHNIIASSFPIDFMILLSKLIPKAAPPDSGKRALSRFWNASLGENDQARQNESAQKKECEIPGLACISLVVSFFEQLFIINLHSL